MFSRHGDRPVLQDMRAPATQVMPATGVRDVVPAPVRPELAAMAIAGESVIGRDDAFEGTLSTQKSVRVLGRFRGRIEAATSVFVEKDATVDADVATDVMIVAGSYSGRLICRERLEIRSSGLARGAIETVRLMLDDGGIIDGELHMQHSADVRGSFRVEVGPEREEAQVGASDPVSADPAPGTVARRSRHGSAATD
jgi:cytoskeletal protein CcmA (bactofilin family)